jgi:structural hemagglutinin/hemolysin toxin protein RtxA
MYKLSFYVPESHAESVKEALFAAGAGTVGNYQRCSWQVLGKGQFMPGEGSKPYLGEVGSLDQVAEYKVEMVCAADCVSTVLAALKSAHPYEQPAWDLVQTITEIPA